MAMRLLRATGGFSQTLHAQNSWSKLLTVVQLQTLFKEIEAVLNTRPLVYVANDINSTMPITPSHFLNMNPKGGIPNNEVPEDSEFKPFQSSAEKFVTIWKKGQ